MNHALQTVVETPEFIKQATALMDDSSRKEFIDFIAENPLKGDLIVGTGGARKIRWAGHAHQGKRGGVRVIYHYHNENIPIFLFTVYAKNQRANITADEKKTLQRIIQSIVKTYGRSSL